MKKLLILSTAALLFSAVSFAGDTGGGKDKKKKTDSTKAMKPCPGKVCSKKKS
ncbi:MAG TPA: hypothetical protein VGM30_11310 [Puia sp.]